MNFAARSALLAVAFLAEAHPARQRGLEPIVLPFELREDYALVAATVNGHPALLILDSGSGVMALDSGFARVADIALDSPGAMIMGARAAGARLGTARRVTLGANAAELTNVRAASVDLAGVQRRVGFDVKGTIGAELFARFVVTVDYEARTITLLDPATFTAPLTGAVVPISRQYGLPVVEASLVTRTRGTLPVRLVLDLGSGVHALRLGARLVASTAIDTDTAMATGLFGVGVGGAIEGKVTRIPELRFGGLSVSRPSTAMVRETDGVFGSTSPFDGTIGAPILRRARVTFDYERSRVVFETRPGFEAPDSIDASGLSLAMDGQRGSTLRVAYVIAGSVADRAGIRVGDEVLQIDSLASPALDVPAARRLLRAAGGRRTLTLRRGTQRYSVQLLLAMPY